MATIRNDEIVGYWRTVAESVSDKIMQTADAAVKSELEAIKSELQTIKADLGAIKSTDGIKKIEDTVLVQLTGSIVEKIRNTAFSVTIAAGAYQTFPVSSEMFDKYRVSIRCGTGSGDRKIAVGAAARDDGNADNTGVYPYLEKSISNTGLAGSTNLHGDTWEIPAIAKNMVIYVKNTSDSSTVMWITIMGVR